ncbi:putative glycerol-3-phosphate acyltransferase 3-like [Capsicum annuum]|nr:putative glycerol-3-phosphate acyltransferase 3-like [Capsicum annuum]KAF3680228.1 putative glycerol-3-phosphate acyltransferase 3-like [Capsicum annuum]
MADWSELQHDLLVLIARRINLIEDYLSFRTVCKSWHAVATKGNFNSDLPRVPWLMLAEDEHDDDRTCRKFFSLYNGMVLKKRIPGAVGKRCMESMGWLITLGKDEGEMSLLHPFSGVQIELPHQNTTVSYAFHRTFKPWIYISKAVLSANPCHTSDYVLVVAEGRFAHLSLWRPGDLLWTRIMEPTCKNVSDVVYFSGRLYTVSYGGYVRVYDVGGYEVKSHLITQTVPWIAGRYYILESLGSLFVVARRSSDIVPFRYDRERIPPRFITVEDDEEGALFMYRTNNFLVFEIDLDANEAIPTRDLGDKAFFLGASASLSVQASQFTGIRPNHIYFTDTNLNSCLYFDHGGGLDMGVFNLADGSIQPHYDGVSLSRFCPPIWVTPNPC